MPLLTSLSLEPLGVGRQLQDLIKTIDLTDVHFVRCMKPNPEKREDLFDLPFVENQLVMTGVDKVIDIRKRGYSQRTPHASFIKQYSMLLPEDERSTYLLADGQADPAKAKVFLEMLIALKLSAVHADNVKVGKTKVLYRIEAESQLDAEVAAMERAQARKTAQEACDKVIEAVQQARKAAADARVQATAAEEAKAAAETSAIEAKANEEKAQTEAAWAGTAEEAKEAKEAKEAAEAAVEQAKIAAVEAKAVAQATGAMETAAAEATKKAQEAQQAMEAIEDGTPPRIAKQSAIRAVEAREAAGATERAPSRDLVRLFLVWVP